MFLSKLSKLVFDTPEGYWLVVLGYHIHKAFWGVLVVVLGTFLIITSSWWYLIVCVSGILLIVLDVAGHIYTNHRPYFMLVEKYEKKK